MNTDEEIISYVKPIVESEPEDELVVAVEYRRCIKIFRYHPFLYSKSTWKPYFWIKTH